MSAKTWTISAALIASAGAAQAVTCEDVSYLDQSFSICTVDVATEDLALFHSDDTGRVIGDFHALQNQHNDKALQFAMNAGMYHADRSPVGLYIESGVQTAPLVTSDGPGNFGLLPNGVLCLAGTRAQVIETRSFAQTGPVCRDATQSGPMLVIDGDLHPRFIPGGSSRKIRNGVGTTADGGTAIFAISNDPVNFHDFGTLFRDLLQTPNALFLDGSISRLFAPALDRDDPGFQLGPMIAVFE